MTQARIIKNPLYMHIERRRAADLMRVLWCHKFGNENNQAHCVASTMTLKQVLETYLLSGGDALDVAPIFGISRSDPRSMLHETSKTCFHWQHSADVISDNEDRSDDQKISIQLVAEIYQLLKDGISHQMSKAEKTNTAS